MSSYLLRRVWQTIPTMFGVIVLVFVLFNWVGGDPAQQLAGLISSPEQIRNIRHQLGLDEPLWRQLLIFVRQVLTFDFGNSWATNEPVAHILTSRLPATLTVMLPVLVLQTVIAVVLASLVAYRHGSLSDRIIMVASTAAVSISFLVYIIVFQWLLAYRMGWFPVQGWSDSLWRNLVTYAPLPILVAVLVGIAGDLRLFRTFMLEELEQDYVRTARAKGVGESRILFVHVMRNALIPVLTQVGTLLPALFVGSFLLEVFFSIPGLGREVVAAVNRSDFPVIKAITVYLSFLTMLVNVVADLLYRMVDPRVTLS